MSGKRQVRDPRQRISTEQSARSSRRSTLDSMPAHLPIPRMTAHVRIGTQGWNYDAWVGPFYPVGTRPADYLTVFSRAFDTVEVDSTFYAVPPVKTVRGWYDRTPNGFSFALQHTHEVQNKPRM